MDLYSTFFTVQVTSYPFPESVNKTEKGDDIVSKVTAAVTAFMGPGTLLDHFKIIPPNTSSVVQEHVISISRDFAMSSMMIFLKYITSKFGLQIFIFCCGVVILVTTGSLGF